MIRLPARAAALPRSLAARLAALPRSLAARLAALPARRRQLAQDLTAGLVLAAVNVVSLLPYRASLHPLWLAVALVAAQGVPLGWRRSAPMTTGLVIGAARVAYDRIGFGFAPFPLGPAIALYTIFDRCSLPVRWAAVALTVAGSSISLDTPGHQEPYDAIFQALILVTAAAAGLLARAHRANLRAAHDRADRAEADLDRRAAQRAAQERARIARELHDVVAHHVSLMAVQAEAASSLLPGRPAEAQRSVEVIGDTARQALTELRRLLGVLRRPTEQPETAPPVSLSEIGGVLDQVRGAGLPVDFTVVGTPARLAAGVDLTAYRIIQEALTNAIRHGPAIRAAVTVTYGPGHVTVNVTDSGPVPAGTVPAATAPSAAAPSAAGGNGGTPAWRPGELNGPGLGLAGIAERVASCGGNLTVGPDPAGGFAVTARLPAL